MYRTKDLCIDLFLGEGHVRGPQETSSWITEVRGELLSHISFTQRHVLSDLKIKSIINDW